MRRLSCLVLVVSLLGPGGALAQRPGTAGAPPAGVVPGGPAGARRAALEQAVVDRFLDRVSTRLGLTREQRRELVQVVRANGAQRRDVARQARLVRQELVRATNDSLTTSADFNRLLERMANLRARDLQLWRAEQADLRRVLTPRQRAQFMTLRLEFAEMVQRARQGQPPGGVAAGAP